MCALNSAPLPLAKLLPLEKVELEQQGHHLVSLVLLLLAKQLLSSVHKVVSLVRLDEVLALVRFEQSVLCCECARSQCVSPLPWEKLELE